MGFYNKKTLTKKVSDKNSSVTLSPGRFVLQPRLAIIKAKKKKIYLVFSGSSPAYTLYKLYSVIEQLPYLFFYKKNYKFSLRSL